MLQLDWRGERLVLLHDKALHWPARKTAIVADPHFGKAAAFRRAGIPIPSGTTAANLARLANVISDTKSQRLIILGDFFHARSGRARQTLEAIARWRNKNRSLDIELVRGNHDRAAGDPPPEWNISCHGSELLEPPFVFSHMTESHSAGYVFAGHVHPSVTLYDRSGGRLRAPCFWFGKSAAVLPAFGDFTGTYSIEPSLGDRVFAVGPDAVVEVRTSRAQRVRH